MEGWLLVAVLYLLAGIVVDVLLHVSVPIVYWDRKHALASHAIVIATWPYTLFRFFFR